VHALEAGCINKSLLAFNRVITALAENVKFVPFRDSKLTYLLMNSLRGSAKTCIIATISPLLSDVETLRVVFRAKSIQKSVAVKFTRELRVDSAKLEVWLSPVLVTDESTKRKVISVEEWTQHHVGEWLQKIGLGDFVEAFQQSGINGSWLLRLNAEDLAVNQIVFSYNQHRLFTTSLECLRDSSSPRTATVALKTPEQFKTSSTRAPTPRSDCHVTKRGGQHSASSVVSEFEESDWLDTDSGLFVSFEEDNDEDVSDTKENVESESAVEEEEVVAETEDARSPPRKRFACNASSALSTVNRLSTAYHRQSIANELPLPSPEGDEPFERTCSEEDDQRAHDDAGGNTDDGYLSN